jgi:hypothetical protein
MGALAGSLSYLRFFLDGEPAKNAGTTYERSIESRRFVALRPKDDVTDSAGWVPTEAPFDDDRPITRDLFLFGNLVCVTYREDKWAIPRALVKRHLEKRLEKIEKDEGKPRSEMGRGFQKVVEAAVLAELKSQSIPRTRLVDVIWDMERGEARVFGRGTLATERVASLMERTFQMRVELASPAARAFRHDLGDRAMSVLERLSPGWLFPESWQKPGDDESEASDAG